MENLKKEEKEKIEKAFKVINDQTYKIFALKAISGNIAAAKLMADREKTLKQQKLKMELFGV